MGAPRDELRLLSIFHWVLAGVAVLFSALPAVYLAVGVAMLRGTFEGRGHPPPEAFGWVMIAVGTAFIVAGLVYAGLLVCAGRCLARTSHWTFVIVVGALSCAFFPVGTALGVFTIIVLSKPEVKILFHPPAAGGPPVEVPPT